MRLINGMSYKLFTAFLITRIPLVVFSDKRACKKNENSKSNGRPISMESFPSIGINLRGLVMIGDRNLQSVRLDFYVMNVFGSIRDDFIGRQTVIYVVSWTSSNCIIDKFAFARCVSILLRIFSVGMYQFPLGQPGIATL